MARTTTRQPRTVTIDLIDFMTVNRFLFDVISDTTITSLKDTARQLAISSNTIHDQLLDAGLPVRLRPLRNACTGLADKLGQPPPVYVTYYRSITDGFLLDDRALELLIPVTSYHFDYKGLILTRFNEMSPDRVALITSKWFLSAPVWDDDWTLKYFPDKESRSFQRQMISFFDDRPDCLKCLTNDELFQANSQLSVAFLHGIVTIPLPGIASPHLKGGFLLGLRASGTGYLTIETPQTRLPISAQKWHDILAWFKANNPLYENVEPITAENVDLRLDPFMKTSAVAAAELPGASPLTDGTNVRIAVKTANGSSTSKYVPLETALELTFPLLFPFGVPVIPGQTWRDKAQALLASHAFYRSGRLQCHLTLYLYHLIQDAALYFDRTRLSVQPLHVPRGTNRDISSNLLFRDPSSPSYWQARQAEVRAMCRQFGDPDLMMTFTFVNKWPEVDSVEAANRSLFAGALDLRFSPIETMLIWKARFLDAKEQGFNKLIRSLGLGSVAHFMWRLEFQARGAPHVHALIWLADRLPLTTIERSLFGCTPHADFPKLHELVTLTMVHECNLARCKHGDPSQPCRYGFPKPVATSAYVSDTGAIILPRSAPDQRIVDYSPAFLLKWGGHCHIHVLRTAEHPHASPNSIFYILKYNFKQEPSLRVDARSGETFEHLLHARIVSSEEAASRIFSFDYYGSDTRCEFLSLKPPDLRSAAFVSGQQIQVPCVERYFLRPPSLDRLSILGFFSLYDVSSAGHTNSERIAQDPQAAEDWASLLHLHNQRPSNSLSDDSWENEHLPSLTLVPSAQLFPATDLPSACALRCSLRSRPLIVLTDKFTLGSDPESVAYAWLLLNGCWRTDDEIRADCASWTEALHYHGLAPEQDVTFHPVYCRLIDYMFTSCRYSVAEMCSIISRMDEDMSPYLQSLLQDAGPQRASVITELLDVLHHRTELERETVPALLPPDLNRARSFIACDFDDAERTDAELRFARTRAQLNPDQAAILDYFMSRLTSGIVTNLFVRGKAGTGKSFLISCIRDLLISRNVAHITCASTGIASSLIHGQTVHSAFAIFTTSNGDTISSLNIARPRGYAVSLATVIIIDEITMISRSVLNCLDQTLRRLSAQAHSAASELPFGGKNIIFFGDLAQVPAVVRARDDFAEASEQFFASLPYSSFATMSLSLIMRQDPGQTELLQLLDDLRSSQAGLSPSSIAALRSRFLPGLIEDVVDTVDKFVGCDSQSGMVVTFTNARASRYNQLILSRRVSQSDGVPKTYDALLLVADSCSYHASRHMDQHEPGHHTPFSVSVASATERRILFGAFRAHHFNTIIPFSLSLAPGARVMLLQNLDVSAGLINGARGTYLQALPNDDALEVLFDCQPPDSPPTVVTRTRSVTYPMANGREIFVYQFPLKLSWAVTAHKAQGQSLDRVAIDISECAFAHGSLYVALSRVRTLDSLLLFGLAEFPTDGPLYHINSHIQYQDAQPSLNDAYFEPLDE